MLPYIIMDEQYEYTTFQIILTPHDKLQAAGATRLIDETAEILF